MNGVTDGYMEWMHSDDDGPDTDDMGEWIGETDIVCPFCPEMLDWRFDHYRCNDCELDWKTATEIEHDRNQSPEEPEDGDRDDSSGWLSVPYHGAGGMW